MSFVAGVDFGTLSVRVSIVAAHTGPGRGRLASGVSDFSATRQALDAAGLTGDRVEAIAAATTGSSVVPLGEGLVPLDDYYVWCDHRAWRELYGGTYSSEWGFSKVLDWLRHNPEKRSRFVTALEHCDMAAATLWGVTDRRSMQTLMINSAAKPISEHSLDKHFLRKHGRSASYGQVKNEG